MTGDTHKKPYNEFGAVRNSIAGLHLYEAYTAQDIPVQC